MAGNAHPTVPRRILNCYLCLPVHVARHDSITNNPNMPKARCRQISRGRKAIGASAADTAEITSG
jgi:hypothetical protein